MGTTYSAYPPPNCEKAIWEGGYESVKWSTDAKLVNALPTPYITGSAADPVSDKWLIPTGLNDYSWVYTSDPDELTWQDDGTITWTEGNAPSICTGTPYGPGTIVCANTDNGGYRAIFATSYTNDCKVDNATFIYAKSWTVGCTSEACNPSVAYTEFYRKASDGSYGHH